MVEFLRYFIFFYCFVGIFISGGLFFNKRSLANIMMAVYIFLFTLELIDFLYTTSDVVLMYPQYYLYIYPICLLFGPALWLHFTFIKNPDRKFTYTQLLHVLPFLFFVGFLLAPILRLEGMARIEYTRENFNNYMMPLNYIRTTHVMLYGIMMVFVIIKERLYKSNRQGIYLTLIAVIYFFTAVLQSYLTRFADSYRQFSLYFFLAATIFLIAGIVLYSYPELLERFQEKYFSSNLKESDRKRIISKIEKVSGDIQIYLNSNLKLTEFCDQIEERPHHVSQVFSSEFSTSFSSFVNEHRVAVAKCILQDPKKDDLKILAVAFECGFNNNVTFNKAFVKCTGMTPGKFRKERETING